MLHFRPRGLSLGVNEVTGHVVCKSRVTPIVLN